MRMGNYLSVRPETQVVMAASQSSFGIRHLTVVPTNFEPEADEAGDEAENETENETENEMPSDARR